MENKEDLKVEFKTAQLEVIVAQEALALAIAKMDKICVELTN